MNFETQVSTIKEEQDISNTGTYLVLSSYTDDLHNYKSRYLRVYHHQFITMITQRICKSKYPCVTERAKQFRIKIKTKCISRWWENIYSWPICVCVCVCVWKRERVEKVRNVMMHFTRARVEGCTYII